MKGNADDAPVVEYTVRVPCTVCGRPYVWPKGSRRPAGIGPCCQPSLLDTPAVRELGERRHELELELEEPPPARDLGWLGLDDVLCEGCRERPAAGRLTPGTPLCLDCAEETLEHLLAWQENPLHDWWAGDDVFGSVRYPVVGWRETEETRYG